MTKTATHLIQVTILSYVTGLSASTLPYHSLH